MKEILEKKEAIIKDLLSELEVIKKSVREGWALDEELKTMMNSLADIDEWVSEMEKRILELKKEIN